MFLLHISQKQGGRGQTSSFMKHSLRGNTVLQSLCLGYSSLAPQAPRRGLATLPKVTALAEHDTVGTIPSRYGVSGFPNPCCCI